MLARAGADGDGWATKELLGVLIELDRWREADALIASATSSDLAEAFDAELPGSAERLARQGRCPAALHATRRVRAAGKKVHGEARLSLVKALHRCGDVDGAAAQLAAWVAEDGDPVSRGWHLRGLPEDPALLAPLVTVFRARVASTPEDGGSYAALDALLDRLGEQAARTHVLLAWASAVPDQAPPLLALGKLLRRQGRLPAAVAAFEEALARDDSDEAWEGLVEAQLAAGWHGSAQRSAAAVAGTDERLGARLLARAAEGRGDLAGAVEAWEAFFAQPHRSRSSWHEQRPATSARGPAATAQRAGRHPPLRRHLDAARRRALRASSRRRR
jgi:tetratricopeptide (TPR) repeat protein